MDTKKYEVREFINGGTDWYSHYYDDPQNARMHIDEVMATGDDAFPWGAAIIHVESGKSLLTIDAIEVA